MERDAFTLEMLAAAEQDAKQFSNLWLPILYPAQVPAADEAGWVRGVNYRVYSCLTCMEDMDRCKCKARKAHHRDG